GTVASPAQSEAGGRVTDASQGAPLPPGRGDWGRRGCPTTSVSGLASSAHPSSDRFAATFSLKGRREEDGRRLPKEPPSPLEGEGSGVRGALSFRIHR